jgi:hypothetical protein
MLGDDVYLDKLLQIYSRHEQYRLANIESFSRLNVIKAKFLLHTYVKKSYIHVYLYTYTYKYMFLYTCMYI